MKIQITTAGSIKSESTPKQAALWREILALFNTAFPKLVNKVVSVGRDGFILIASSEDYANNNAALGFCIEINSLRQITIFFTGAIHKEEGVLAASPKAAMRIFKSCFDKEKAGYKASSDWLKFVRAV